MEIKQYAKVHNRFDITVCDARTGEVKQTAVAYNVVLDNYFKVRLGLYSSNLGTSAVVKHIYVGTGSGTPAITDTALFTQLIRKELSVVETVYAYPTSHRTYQIKLEANECNNSTITEVGLGVYNYIGSTAYTALITHAMLQDSEGQQISIVKTDEDVVYINAIFYVTVTLGGFGTNGIYPVASQNRLIKHLFGDGLGSSYEQYSCLISTKKTNLTYSSDLMSKEQTCKNQDVSVTNASLSTLTYNLGDLTVLDSEWNNHQVGTFGIPSIGAFVLPDASVFPDYAVTRTALGTGDGTTQDFNIKCPNIKDGSLHVFVNNIELSASEYIFDANNNCKNDRENYYTADMDLSDTTHIHFGNFTMRSTAGDGYYCDPLQWQFTNANTEGKLYPSYCTVSAANPIWIDFTAAKACNRLKIDSTSANSYIAACVIEYSTDNETWTRISDAVLTTTDGTKSGVKLYEWAFTEVSAQYWRVYNPNNSFSYSLYAKKDYVPSYGDSYFNFGLRDGTRRINATFFLGRSVPGLHLNTAPAVGEAVEATYVLTTPYKTANNILRMTCTVQLARG